MRILLTLGATSAVAATLFLQSATSSDASLTASSVEAVSAPLAATTYGVDLGHSNILFKCKHLGVSYQWGRFDKFDGEFILDADAAASSVSITVDASSVNSNSQGRDKHLRNSDFFNVKQFPEMTFKSTEVTMGEGDAYTVVGDLTFHGVTKSVTMDVTKVGEADTGKMGQRAGFEGTFTIDRMDFGVDTYADMLGHDVTLMFAIEGIKK